MYRICGYPARYVQGYAVPASAFRRQEDGSYTSTTGDQIVNNLVDEIGYNSSEVVVTQTYEEDCTACAQECNGSKKTEKHQTITGVI